MRVAVTGGTGFIGLAIAEQLGVRGDSVRLLGSGALPPSIAAHRALKEADVLYGDVRSHDDLAGLIDEGTDVVIHAAAITPDAEMEAARAREIVSVNIGGTVEVLARAREVGVRRVVVLSSVAVYGNERRIGEAALAETTTPAPSTLYGIAKLASEQAALRLGSLWSLDVRVVRLGPAFGPWEYHSGFRPILSPPRQVLDQAMCERACVLARPMKSDFIYSRDAAHAIVRIAACETLDHSTFNLGGEVWGLDDWCEILATCIDNFQWRFHEETATVRPVLEHDRAVLDSGRFEAAFGPVARTTHAQQAEETIRWLQETA